MPLRGFPIVLAALWSVGAIPAAEPEEPKPGPSSKGDSYYQFLLGKISRFEGELGAAADHLHKAASSDNSSAIRTELAQTYLRMGDLSQAVQQARLATQASPEDVDARRTLVEAYMASASRGADKETATGQAIDEIRAILRISPRDDELRLTLCRLLVQEGRTTEALGELRALKASGGDPVTTGLLIARVLLGDNRTAEAETELNAALAASPENYEALLALAQIAEGREDWDGAVAYFRRLTAGRPEDDLLRGRLGYALLRTGKIEEAIEQLREIASRNPQSRSVREMLVRALHAAGRPGEALRELQGLLEYQPDDPNLLIEAARLHESRSERDLALEAYRRAASGAEEQAARGKNPLTDGARQGLRLAIASLEIESGDPAAAARTLEPIERDGSDLGLHAASLRVRAFGAAGRTAEAVDQAMSFLRTAPDDRRGPLLLLEARLADPSRRAAEAAVDEFRPDRRGPDALASAIGLLQSAGKGKIAAGLGERALTIHPQDPGLHLALGALHERLGNGRKAEAHLSRAIELDPKDGRALNYLGYYLADRGKDLPRAESLIRQAVAIDPTNGAYIDSLGWVLFKLGRLDEAEAMLTQAVDLLAGDGTVHEHLGDLYMKKKKPLLALVEWKTAQGLRTEDPERLRRKIADVSGAQE